jgi:hypothetical protein
MDLNMAEIITTTPTQPYFGEFWNAQIVTMDTISALAQPSPLADTFQPYAGTALPPGTVDKVVRPLVLSIDPAEADDCFWKCLTGESSAVIGGSGAALAASGWVPKAWVGLPRGLGNASRFTTPTSILAHKVPSLGALRFPVGRSLLGTRSVLRFIGRFLPGIGWALLAADLIAIDQCVAACTGKRSVLRALCEELTPFCIKPAY